MTQELVSNRPSRPSNVKFENVRILFRNFAGKEGQYNREGDRNFALVLDDPKIAHQMLEDGWNVKYLKPRDEGDQPQAYIQVAVSYKIRPPKTVLITGGFQNEIPEHMLEIFDWIDIEYMDLTLNPSPWSVNGKSGIKAYLANMYVTMRQDELELKYEHIPKMQESSLGILENEIGKPLALEAGQDPNIIDAEIVEDDEDVYG